MPYSEMRLESRCNGVEYTGCVGKEYPPAQTENGV
jgi:hypothetical protein